MKITDRRLASVAQELAEGRVRVLSVDVFDTLLWRRVPEPFDLFLVLGKDLAQAGLLAADVSVTGFAELRRTAERVARERVQTTTGYREVTLADIYAALPQNLFAQDFGREVQVGAELACEQRMLVADPEIAALIHAAKQGGARVILVSDTYFKANEVRDFLAAAGCEALPIDRLYVSCEAGKPKYRDLFDTVLTDMGCAPAEMVHVGDSHEADIAPCAARQIRSVHYDKWAFSPRVQKVEFPPEAGARAALLGRCGDFGLTGLRARLQFRAPSELAKVDEAYWQIGAAQLGPVFAGFARWIVGACAARQVTKVFGIMREGRFLGRLVDATARDLGVPLKTEEVWLSRRAVIGASLYADDLSRLGDAIAVAPGESEVDILASLGLTQADVTAVLPGFAVRTNGALSALTEAILGSAGLRAKVLARAEDLRRGLLKGLAKHFDINSPQRVVLMDLGYAATIQTVLAGILAREGAKVQLEGLYLALNERALLHRQAGSEIQAFIGNDGYNALTARLLTRTPDVLEHACMCREGSLARYDAKGAPVLLANQRSATQLAQMDVLQEGILAGAATVNRLLGDLARTAHDAPALAAQVGRMIEGLLLHPSRQEAETLGAWQHEANFDLADRRALTDLAFDPLALEYRGYPALLEAGRHQVYWPAAAFAKVNPFLADAFAAGVAGEYAPVHLSSGPLLGGLAITPDLGAGFDAKRGGTVPLALNSFGRGEIKVMIKGFGAEAFTRLRLSWPAAQAVVALSAPQFIAHGESEVRAVAVRGVTWTGVREIETGVNLSGAAAPETIIDLGAPPPFAHALEMTLRFRYLRLTPLFGMQ